MTVKVLLFAGAREAVGADSVDAELAEQATFADLAAELTSSHPSLAPFVAVGRFAASAEYVLPGDPVDPLTEIALIPPVSGG